MKISEKVSFNIASEASYVYILSGQKFIKNAEMVNLASFWKSEAYGQTVLPDKSLLIGHKLVESAEMENLSCDILVIFKHCVLFEKLLHVRLESLLQMHFSSCTWTKFVMFLSGVEPKEKKQMFQGGMLISVFVKQLSRNRKVTSSQCLKITEKVAFNIASEASYVYILSGQKFKKMPKMVNFDEFL